MMDVIAFVRMTGKFVAAIVLLLLGVTMRKHVAWLVGSAALVAARCFPGWSRHIAALDSC